MKPICILGALDTKGAEFKFLKRCIESQRAPTLVVDIGVLGKPAFRPNISREKVAAAGGAKLADLVARNDRGEAVAAMARGAAKIVRDLHAAGKISGIISMGGGGGTSMATAAMRELPVGFPKLMVSTIVGNLAQYVGTKDITFMPSVVDIAGINRISRTIMARAAGAIVGMARAGNLIARSAPRRERPVIVASMFGNTTGCVEHARGILGKAGYEVLVFHATGTGGRTMESLIEGGYAAGVLDITTTEWADELVGGILSAGPTRLEAAARAGVPAVVAPGCLDMVNFGPRETVPSKFQHRQFYQHNAQVTLMRTTPDECAQLGRLVAKKLNASRGPVRVFIPLRGISVISAPGQPFYWPEADAILFGALKTALRKDIPVAELDCNINDPVFAEACAAALLEMLGRKRR